MALSAGPALSASTHGRNGRICSGTTVEQEEHPTTKDLVAALMEPGLRWVNCGLCVDERGAGNVIDGVKRGSPADFFTMAVESTTTLVIPTR